MPVILSTTVAFALDSLKLLSFMLPFVHVAPLVCAAIYAVGALLLKRSADLGFGLWRTAFVVNIITAVVYQPLWLLGGRFQVEKLWQPALIAVCFIVGQMLSLISLDRGDVSVATPVLGVKILLVALFVTLLGGERITTTFWIAAGLSTAAIALLNRRPSANHHDVGLTITTAVLSAAAFALFDVLMRRWSPAWGVGALLPLTLLMVALASFAMIPLFHAPLFTLARPAWPWLLGGSALLSVQSVLYVSVIAAFGNVTAANIMYSSRGLWSVVIVWIAGHWFSNREQHIGASILRWRLTGAVLMMAAITLVLL
jgi:drug/metabolite transporter (DMT)-like permease